MSWFRKPPQDHRRNAGSRSTGASSTIAVSATTWSVHPLLHSDVVRYALGAAFFTVVTVLCARAAIWLPITPVPVTLQVLAAILAGLVLGPRWGSVSQVQYVTLGLSGLPVFAAAAPGPAALFSPTAGYLVGLPAGAFLAGVLGRKWAERGWLRALACGLAGVAAIYVCGASWLAVWLVASGAATMEQSWWQAFSTGVAPFLPFDAVKAALAAAVWRGGRRCLALPLPYSS